MFCAPIPVFSGTERVGSHFHVLRSRTHFQRYRGRRVPLSCFALSDRFLAELRVSGLIFMFCASGLIFIGTEGVGSRFPILCSRSRFRRNRARRVPFSCFCTFVPVIVGTERVESHFHPLLSGFHFRRYRGHRVPLLCFTLLDSFSCFALPDPFPSEPSASGSIFFFFSLQNSFSAVPRASGPVLMFCASRLVFDGTEGTRSSFHVLGSRTHFRRYRGRRVPFSCFALADSFLAEPRASSLILMFCAAGLIFGGTKGVRSLFHVLRSRTRFRQYIGRRVPFPCFALPDQFSTEPSESGLIFMFYAPDLNFDGIERVGSVFMFCAPRLIFGCTEGVGSRFHVLRSRTRFHRYRVHQVLF
jgi:hypothetical protein